MTRVTLRYDLARPLTDDDLSNISATYGTYGLLRIQLAPSLNSLSVDYDASRLMKKDVEAVLLRHGIPIQTAVSA